MNNISLDDIALFIRVIDAGGFTACAREVGLPKSSVSRRLAALEKQLGVRLLERTTRRMHLTAEGDRFYRYGQPLVTELLQLHGLVVNQNDELHGRLRLLLNRETMPLIQQSVIRPFIEQNPRLSLEVDLQSSHLSQQPSPFDLALSFQPLTENSGELRSEPLLSIGYALYASQSYLDQAGELTQPDQLLQHRLITMLNEPVLQMQRRNRHWRIDSTECSQQITTNDFGYLYDSCKQGMGIALLPTHVVEQDPARHDLVKVLPGHQIDAQTLYAIFPERGYIDPRTQLLLSYLRQQLTPVEQKAAA